jgi:RNA polymerase sigma-70 factor, ECF subfamily
LYSIQGAEGAWAARLVSDVAALIQHAKEYDQRAFAELYRLAVVPVYRYLSARLNAAEEVEELTQEVFVAALSGFSSLKATDESGLMAWLLQIARHKLADHLRQRYRRPLAPLVGAEMLPDPDPRPDEMAEIEAERAEVRQALDQLTPEQREVVICKYVMGYDNERTARLMEKNANSVNQLHHRALASLHRHLTKTEKRT